MNDQWKIDVASADTGGLKWSSAPLRSVAGENEIHLWRANLDLPGVGEFRDVLSAAEVIRADSFHAERDRQRFIAAHGILRLILARYLDTAAAAIRFNAGPHGKPALAENTSGLHFNLSHSGDLAVVAIARGREVGVDVEQIREDFPVEEMAENYFEPEEIWSIRTLRGRGKSWRFFELWAAKEAVLKASGAGLGEGLKPRAEEWGLRQFPIVNKPTFGVAKEYAGAVAARTNDWRLLCWEWHDQPGAGAESNALQNEPRTEN